MRSIGPRARLLAVLFVGLALSSAPRARAEGVSPQAAKLIAIVDALDVEHHWPAGVHVSWQTGVPDGRPENGPGKHTHCSAFVAAAAKRLGIYILRPPEHLQLLLANAQYEWLATEGAGQGWGPVRGPWEAQEAANQGLFVVATYRNHKDDKPGHIAIIRPSNKPRPQVMAEGPDLTQAGGTNYRATSLAQGFAGHPRAFGSGEILYYAHAPSPEALAKPAP